MGSWGLPVSGPDSALCACSLVFLKPPRLVHDPVLKTGVPRLRDKPLRPGLVWNEMFTERDRTFLHAHHMLQ